jgi:hypothetical protein
MSTKEESDGPEVLYHEAATPLFIAIEEMDWREAFDIAEENPAQVQTWVRSHGTENTTFHWSVWRRLPIHEVSNFFLLFSTSQRLGSLWPMAKPGFSNH